MIEDIILIFMICIVIFLSMFFFIAFFVKPSPENIFGIAMIILLFGLIRSTINGV